MAINKNFVIKHGIEIAADALVLDSVTKNVGIGTSIGRLTLDVRGSIGSTSLSVSGIGTIVNGNIINLTGTAGTITNGTITNLTGTAGTITTFNSTNGTIVNLSGTNLNYSGIGTITNLSGVNINITGVVTATSFFGSGANLTGIANTGNIVSTAITTGTLNVTGVSTLGTVKISSGIITATSGVVTYFGDGSYLTGLPGNPTLQQVLNAGNTSTIGMSISGVSTFTNGPILVGTATSTRTASQPLQVTGGAYVSGNLGIGSTNPTSALFVVGDARVTGVVTATTFSGNVNAGVGTITNLTGTAGTITNFNSTNLTGTAGTITTFNSTNGTITNLTGTAGTITNFNSTNLTGTAGTITTFNSTNGTITNLTGTAGTITNFNSTNLTGTAGTITTFNSTNGTITNLTGTAGTITNLTATSAIVGSATTINSTGLNVTGIVTASGGFNIGIQSGGLNVTTGVVTALNFIGVGNTFLYNSSTKTVNISISGGGSLSISTSTSSTPQFITFVSSASATSIGITASNLTFIPSSGSLGIGTTNPTSNLTVIGDVNVTGIITCADINSTSDIKLKENIHTVQNALDVVDNLRGVSFDWKETGRSSYGVIAQELEAVLPELVGDGETKSVNYNGIIGVLIEAIKELKKEIGELKSAK